MNQYSECGRAFARIARGLGRQITGKPLLLHYDTEFREDDADFEACLPLRRPAAAEGISVRELAGGRSVTLIHRGPYDQLGHSYAKLLKFVHDHGYNVTIPTREVYLKGPGMIFRGNPRSYLTEIQMLVAKGWPRRGVGGLASGLASPARRRTEHAASVARAELGRGRSGVGWGRYLLPLPASRPRVKLAPSTCPSVKRPWNGNQAYVTDVPQFECHLDLPCRVCSWSA